MKTINNDLSLAKNLIIEPGHAEKYLMAGRDFIDDDEILRILREKSSPEPGQVQEILQKSLSIETLSLEETALLLNVTDPELLEEMRQTGAKVKKKVYDNRIVTFAPLYLSNHCVNNCAYCGFRASNETVCRERLSLEQVKAEIKVLAGQIGHKRLIAVYGEHPDSDIDYMEQTLAAIYSVEEKTRFGSAKIRRVNVNAAPLSVEKLKRLKNAGIGTYQVFQETYHHATYAKLHPQPDLKSDYRWRLYAMHRALESGIDDVGIGALFGLYDWKFEVLGLVAHSLELERVFGIGPHTVSFPRLEPAFGAAYANNSPFRVSDEDFKKLVTVIRLAIPHAGMIITARESEKMRDEIIPRGCTQTDASTRIGIGAYSRMEFTQQEKDQQFLLGDTRSLEELIRKLAQMGYITSFCTAGYRCGRTGECIMELLKSGKEGVFCKLNAVLTFREWLDDFAGPQTREICEPLIAQEINEVQEKLPEFYQPLLDSYQRTRQGERDLYF